MLERRGLREAVAKMVARGVPEPAIRVFSDHYEHLASGETGIVPEQTIRPLADPPTASPVDDALAREALSRTVVIKLNGGLGTSMGMGRAKSLLPVRDGLSFLDLIVAQVLAVRRRLGVRLPVLFMNSFRTHQDTLDVLGRVPGLAVDGLPLDFGQSQEPKLRADDLTPVTWPADPDLEWCPPGHGDIYPSLLSSGLLDRLIDAGFEHATVSNSDNLGAAPDAGIAGWFASSGAPYAAEVCTRTPMDRKGGHLAERRSDGRLVLRDSAQTDPAEADLFSDISRHPYFHTNNLWWNLRAVRDVLRARDGVLGLPLIRNLKTVDPTDPSSTPVVQIESAMGAAIEAFPGATAVAVARSRFQPVKTTNELLLLRSDVYETTEDGRLEQVAPAPHIALSEHYRTIDDFEARFPAGPPSLRGARSLTVRGDWTFGAGVTVVGDVTLGPEGGVVADGAILG